MAASRIGPVALALVAGILSADRLQPSAPEALAAGVIGAVFLIAAAVLHRRHPEPEPGSLLPRISVFGLGLVVLGSAAAGFCSLGVRSAVLHNSYLPKVAGQTVRLTGSMTSDPRPGPYSTRFYLRAEWADSEKVVEKVAVNVYGPMPEVSLGDRVQFSGSIRALDPADPFDASLGRRSVVAKATVTGSEVRVLARTGNPVLAASNHFRTRFSQAATASVGENRAGLLLGLVIGDQRHIPRRVTDDFRAAGLSHLTAVSGQNVAMVLAPLLLLMTVLGLKRRTRVLVAVAVLVMFAFVTRWEPSVLRAVIMATLALVAWAFGRRPNPAYALGLVFVGLLAVDPLMLWSIGFQLSFAATAGILLLAPALEGRLEKVLNKLRATGRASAHGVPADSGSASSAADPTVKGVPRPRKRLSDRTVQAASIGIAAQAAVLPFIVWHFGRISLVALPANLAAFPLVGPATVLGLIAGVVGLVSPVAAKLFFVPAGLSVSALQAVAHVFGGSSYAQIDVPEWGPAQTIAFYLTLAAIFMWLVGKRRTARWPAVVAVLSLLLGAVAPVAGSANPSGMRLTFFNVGQGDSALVETPGGARVLIDGGPDPNFVADRLARRGVRRLDLVVASHGHADHVVGLGKVLGRFSVREAVDPGVPTSVMDRVHTVAGETGLLEAASEDEKMVIGDLTVEMLGPTAGQKSTAADHQEKEGAGLNDASVVARVSFGGQCALFTGDIEEGAQQVLLETHARQIQCSILKAPHHGSSKLLAGFVRAVAPSFVAISVGPNDYGHPTQKALSTFQKAGAKVLRTDRLGDIVLNVSSDGRVTLNR